MKLGWQAWAKLAMFCGAGASSAVLVFNTLSVPVRGDTTQYRAEFSSVEGLNIGNPVTMNGIRVGRVDSIRFTDNGNGTSRADVGLEVASGYTFSAQVSAAIRYGDMLGARYVALSDPGGAITALSTGEPPPRLLAGGVIPMIQTTPAVDLTALLNGFKPLFDALQPEQVNSLTRGFVEAFSGQGQTVTTLLAQIATMTTSMRDNDGVFTSLVANVSKLMGTVNTRQPELEQMLAGLQRLAATVSSGDGQLEALIDQGNAVLATLSGVVDQTGTDYGDTISNLRAMIDTWNDHTPEFTGLLGTLPQFADSVNRSTSYGGFVSLYLCNFTLKIAKHEANIFGHRHSEVCR